MTLLTLWEKIGKQPLREIKYIEPIVLIDGKEYIIDAIKYQSGHWAYMTAVQKCCKTCKNNLEYPPPHTCDVCTSEDRVVKHYMWEPKEVKKRRNK